MISRNGRIAAILIALVVWAGLAVQFRASLAMAGSVPQTLWVMLRFFTIIANLLTAFAFTAIAIGRDRWLTPARLGGITLAMMLVGIVYALLLQGLLELSGGAALADLLLHKVTPILVPLFWLVFAPHRTLTSRDAIGWAALPLAYFVYALVRGRFEGVYAYPFLNVAKLGWPQVLATAVVMALCFLLAGQAMVWLDRRLGFPLSRE